MPGPENNTAACAAVYNALFSAHKCHARKRNLKGAGGVICAVFAAVSAIARAVRNMAGEAGIALPGFLVNVPAKTGLSG
jgi:hypothetical protein